MGANSLSPTMMVDLSLCVGCEACTVVCKQIYNLAPGIFRTRIDTVESGTFPRTTEVPSKKACMHCDEAACVLVCPAKACYKRDDGLVVIDQSRCIGCNYCVANCTFSVVRYDQARGTAEKCTMCAGRIDNGKSPLCAEVCTAQAISFGTRSWLLTKANDRVLQLKSQGFADASVYGETELGGLQVLSVLRERPEAYALPSAPEIPGGVYAWRYVSSPVGGLAAVAGLAALAFNFIHNRKFRPDNEA